MRALHFGSFVLASTFAIGCTAANDKGTEVLGDTGADETAADTGGSESSIDLDVGTDGGFTTEELTLEPLNAVVYIDLGVTPLAGGKQDFKALLSDKTDVTSGATFTVDDTTLGSFGGATFTSVTDLGKDAAGADVLGRTSIVSGISSDGKKGQAKITVVKLRKTEDPKTSARDFFFTVPFKAAPDPAEDILKFTTNIQQVDVAFVMDSTGSMSGAITNLRTNLSSTILPALKAAIPSVGVSIVDHKDYPTGGYGGGGDFPVKILTPIVVQATAADLTTVQTATTKYAAAGGSDTPESQLPAMFHVLTGKALSWPGGSIAAVTPKAGTNGAVGFRGSAVPVVVMITDASFHNGVYGASNGFGETIAYSIAGSPTMANLVDAFKALNAKIVGVNVAQSWSASDGPAKDFNHLSDNTNSKLPPSAFDGAGKPAGCGAGQCCTGLNGAGKAPDAAGGLCRLNFDANSAGSGVSTGIVTAIKAIASGSVYDILPELANDPKNPDGVDATKFVDRLEAFADASKGCAGTPRKSEPSKTYNDVIGGIVAGKQTACFKVIPKMNESVPPKESAQFFKAIIRMKGIAPGVTVTPTTPRVDLGDDRTALFMVPPTPPIAK